MKFRFPGSSEVIASPYKTPADVARHALGLHRGYRPSGVRLVSGAKNLWCATGRGARKFATVEVIE